MREWCGARCLRMQNVNDSTIGLDLKDLHGRASTAPCIYRSILLREFSLSRQRTERFMESREETIWSADDDNASAEFFVFYHSETK